MREPMYAGVRVHSLVLLTLSWASWYWCSATINLSIFKFIFIRDFSLKMSWMWVRSCLQENCLLIFFDLPLNMSLLSNLRRFMLVSLFHLFCRLLLHNSSLHNRCIVPLLVPNFLIKLNLFIFIWNIKEMGCDKTKLLLYSWLRYSLR